MHLTPLSDFVILFDRGQRPLLAAYGIVYAGHLQVIEVVGAYCILILSLNSIIIVINIIPIIDRTRDDRIRQAVNFGEIGSTGALELLHDLTSSHVVLSFNIIGSIVPFAKLCRPRAAPRRVDVT